MPIFLFLILGVAAVAAASSRRAAAPAPATPAPIPAPTEPIGTMPAPMPAPAVPIVPAGCPTPTSPAALDLGVNFLPLDPLDYRTPVLLLLALPNAESNPVALDALAAQLDLCGQKCAGDTVRAKARAVRSNGVFEVPECMPAVPPPGTSATSSAPPSPPPPPSPAPAPTPPTDTAAPGIFGPVLDGLLLFVP